MYGQLKLLPLSSMSLISVSIGVFPTSRTKNSCSITCDDTVLSEGNRSSSLPNLVGWFGYWVLQYSSRAHCDFSWSDSMCATSDSPHASETEKEQIWLEECGKKRNESQWYFSWWFRSVGVDVDIARFAERFNSGGRVRCESQPRASRHAVEWEPARSIRPVGMRAN